MVARNHDDPHSSLAAAAHGGGDAGPERVADPYKTESSQLPGIVNGSLSRSFRDHENAQAALGQPNGLVQKCLPTAMIQRLFRATAPYTRAPRCQFFGGALDAKPALDDGGVEGLRRVKGILTLALLIEITAQTRITGGLDNGDIGRMNGRVGGPGARARQGGGEQDVSQIGSQHAGEGSLAIDVGYKPDRESSLGQSPCFIRARDIDTSERLDGRQPPQ
jgi:hypothetical protein